MVAEQQLTGGLTNYYLAQVTHPQRVEQDPYQAECEDIIRALNMTFDEGCEFKAIWRTAAARLGNGKSGQKALYDAEKRVHYAQASLRQLQQEKQIAEDDGWLPNLTGKRPGADRSLVEVILRDGTHYAEPRRVDEYTWGLQSETAAIVKYRFVI